MRQARHLVIFARYPKLGTGKRRLAKDIGAIKAVRFQRVMLRLALRRLGSDRRWTTWLAVTPDDSGPWPRGFRTLPQGRGDLGHRMAAVIRKLPPGPVAIIGSDVPGISASDIASAFRELGRCDAVFGPATDGGYWLVGLRRRPHFLNPFSNVRWSTRHTLADTLRNLEGRNVGFLDMLTDVDDGPSLRQHPHWAVLHGRYFRQAALTSTYSNHVSGHAAEGASSVASIERSPLHVRSQVVLHEGDEDKSVRLAALLWQ